MVGSTRDSDGREVDIAAALSLVEVKVHHCLELVDLLRWS